MPGKVNIDLNRRTVGSLRLLWNRLTPTRGAKVTSNIIANVSSSGPLKVSVGEDQLVIKIEQREIPIALSNNYAHCLSRAGVAEIEIAAVMKSKEIKALLDALADKRVNALERFLAVNGFITKSQEISANKEHNKSTHMPVKWEIGDYFLSSFTAMYYGVVFGSLLGLGVNRLLGNVVSKETLGSDWEHWGDNWDVICSEGPNCYYGPFGHIFLYSIIGGAALALIINTSLHFIPRIIKHFQK